MMASRYAHAKQFKRHHRQLRLLRSRLGRIICDIRRKFTGRPELEAVFEAPIARAAQIRSQQQRQRGWKLYSFHAPEVECIIYEGIGQRLPHGVRGHPRLQHRQPKFASSVTRLGEGTAIGIRLVESFLTGLSCSQQNFPQSMAGRLPIWRHDRRSSARLPWADDAPPYAATLILVNDYGPSLPPSEIITRALIDPILTRWGAS